MWLFPIDEETLKYLKFSGRDNQTVKIVEDYAKAQGLWASKEIEFTDTLPKTPAGKVNRKTLRESTTEDNKREI